MPLKKQVYEGADVLWTYRDRAKAGKVLTCCNREQEKGRIMSVIDQRDSKNNKNPRR